MRFLLSPPGGKNNDFLFEECHFLRGAGYYQDDCNDDFLFHTKDKVDDEIQILTRGTRSPRLFAFHGILFPLAGHT